VHKAGVTNVRALLGDAEALVLHHFAPDSLSEVFVNHPCPWPKERHARRRLLHHRFLELLAERMRPGARLTIVTDHAPHATWLATELAQQSALESCAATIESREPEGRSPTKYQRKAMAQGVPIHYFEWRKRADSPPSTAARAHSSAAAMPNLKLRGDVPAAELFRGFEPQSFREQARGVEVVIKLQGVYRQLDAPVWLLEAFVQEDHLRQEFGIAVIAREDSLLVKPSMIGAPHPTRGVKRAIWCVGRWLVERHPLLAVQSSSLGDDLSLPGASRPPG